MKDIKKLESVLEQIHSETKRHFENIKKPLIDSFKESIQKICTEYDCSFDANTRDTFSFADQNKQEAFNTMLSEFDFEVPTKSQIKKQLIDYDDIIERFNQDSSRFRKGYSPIKEKEEFLKLIPFWTIYLSITDFLAYPISEEITVHDWVSEVKINK